MIDWEFYCKIPHEAVPRAIAAKKVMIEMISKPLEEEEETIVAPIPVSGCVVAGAVIAKAEEGGALNAASILKRIGK